MCHILHCILHIYGVGNIKQSCEINNLLACASEGRWGREVRGYEWDFENSGLGGLLSLLNFVGMGFWEI